MSRVYLTTPEKVMSTLANLTSFGPRIEDVELLQKAFPEAVRMASKDVGMSGVQNFFDGYKTSIDEAKLAA